MRIAYLVLPWIFAIGLCGQGVPRPKYLEGIGIQQQLNAQVPLNATFRDEFGRPVQLGQYMTGRPVVLAMVYYTCPALCDQILHGMVAAMRQLSLKPGREFDVVAISINPNERPSEGAEKRMNVVNAYLPNSSMDGWHFLTGDERNIRMVADAVGYRYRYDPATKMYFHGAGFMVLTPEAKVARYLYGVSFEPKDLKLSLIEASHHRIGSPVDEILLFCCRYDAATGKYTLTVLTMLRAAALMTLLLLIAGFFVMLRRDAVRRRALERHP